MDKVRVASRRYIPRGCSRTNYIPGLSEESKSLFEEYMKQYARAIGASIYRKQTGTDIQHNSINLLKTLTPSQKKNMVGSWTRYVWLLEGIFQEDVVEQTTYPVYQKNQRACLKSI